MERERNVLSVDLLNGPIFKSLVIFALPLLASNIFQQLYNTADAMIVGRCLGDLSLAAIGAASPIYELMVGFALGIGNGLSIVTARYFGSGDEGLLKKSVASSIIIGFFVTIIVTIVAQVSLRPLLELLNTPEKIVDEAYGYISTITLFTIVMFAYNLCAGLLRAMGNSFMPLVFLVISSCTNIVLDLLFISVFGMGIEGAAIATVISQGISVILCLIYIFKCAQQLIPGKEHFTFDKKIYAELLGQGFSMGFMSSIVSAGSVILQSGINGLGYLTIAGHTAARKLYMFTAMPVTTMGLAGSTFVSQNRGADNVSRIRKCMKYQYIYSLGMASIMTILMLLFAPALISLISGSNDPVIIGNGSLYLRCCSPFYVVLGMLIDTRYALQSLGNKLLPLVSSVIEFLGKILFVTVFIPQFQYMAVIFCEPAIWCVMTIQLLYTFYTNPYIKNGRKTYQNQ